MICHGKPQIYCRSNGIVALCNKDSWKVSLNFIHWLSRSSGWDIGISPRLNGSMHQTDEKTTSSLYTPTMAAIMKNCKHELKFVIRYHLLINFLNSFFFVILDESRYFADVYLDDFRHLPRLSQYHFGIIRQTFSSDFSTWCSPTMHWCLLQFSLSITWSIGKSSPKYIKYSIFDHDSDIYNGKDVFSYLSQRRRVFYYATGETPDTFTEITLIFNNYQRPQTRTRQATLLSGTNKILMTNVAEILSDI